MGVGDTMGPGAMGWDEGTWHCWVALGDLAPWGMGDTRGPSTMGWHQGTQHRGAHVTAGWQLASACPGMSLGQGDPTAKPGDTVMATSIHLHSP